MLTKSLLLEKFFIKDMDNLLDKVHKEQNIIGMGWSLANVYTGLLVMISRLLVLGF